MSEIYFISGSCGVGKSTLIPYLKKMLSKDKYRVFDFDQRGVPENADSSWRKSEAEHWMSIASELGKKDINIIVCGFVKPADLTGNVKFILLDIQPEILRQRLMQRYSQNGVFDSSQKVIGKPVLDFIESNIYILGEMQKMFQAENSAVIDTSNLTPEEVAKHVIDIFSRTIFNFKKMKKEMKKEKDIEIYQAKDGSIEFSVDVKKETIWASRKDIAQIFDIDRSVVSKHIKKIFSNSELDKNVVRAKIAHTTKHGALKGKTQTKEIEVYSLDIILAVGYRTASSKAIRFRKWSSKILKGYLTEGFVVNKKQISNNYDHFLEAVESIKKLSNGTELIGSNEALDLVKAFADTWVSLDAYDKSILPKKGSGKKEVSFTAEELEKSVVTLKSELMRKGEASELFAQEKNKGSFAGIVGNIFQTFGGKELYPSASEKAAHLLYFVVKNHVFNDGNKRTGAFSFVWFLQKAGMLDKENMTPTALTSLTLLIAESDPKDKENIIGLVLLLLKK